MRNNLPGSAASATELPLEVTGDYATWMNRAETTWQFLKEVRLIAYVDFVERYSDVSALEYDRFSTGLNATYAYEF
jgi:hypothetical protein